MTDLTRTNAMKFVATVAEEYGPMTDEELVRHLRNSKGWPTLGNAAADCIEALKAENARLREALEFYADPCDAPETGSCGYEGNMCCRTARAALKGDSHD